MKLYISADIEGVACIADPAEANRTAPRDYDPFCRQMTAEVAAACAGAHDAGADTIVIRDAHGTGRNIDVFALDLPPGLDVSIIRGWSGHPFGMVEGLDATFDCAAFIGYHSAAGCGGNPLAHTVSGRMFSRVELNGAPASEFRLYGLAAASVGVPVVFVSADQAQCEEAQQLVDGITTVPVFAGFGASVRSMPPRHAVARIRDGVRTALTSKLPPPIERPGRFDLRLHFVRASDAYAMSFYPSATLVADTEVMLATDDLLHALAFLRFSSRQPP